MRTLVGLPPIRRDLIKRHLYLVPNSIVVSRGCPHACDFCYKEAFFEGGKVFYTQAVDDALAEIERLPGRHLYFLDDHLFGNPRFAAALFDGMRGMGRLWQAAGTVKSVLRPDLLEKAVDGGLRSLFVGFETLSPANLREQHKYQNLDRDYAAAIRRLHDLGVMVNGSFVFGMDGDDASVFERTVEWAIEPGHRDGDLPHPHALPRHRAVRPDGGRGSHPPPNWDLYDTRHVVYRPARMSPEALEAGYWRAYRDFYRWGSILRGARTKPTARRRCGTSPTPAAGRSSSRCGTGSSGRSGSRTCCPCSRTSWPASASTRRARLRHPRPRGTRRETRTSPTPRLPRDSFCVSRGARARRGTAALSPDATYPQVKA